MDVRRVASTWKIMTSLHDIEMKDNYNVFFDTLLGTSFMRYFKLQRASASTWK